MAESLEDLGAMLNDLNSVSQRRWRDRHEFDVCECELPVTNQSGPRYLCDRNSSIRGGSTDAGDPRDQCRQIGASGPIIT
ncbi:unnamed protein product, partial [Iphiclides podalirius]